MSRNYHKTIIFHNTAVFSGFNHESNTCILEIFNISVDELIVWHFEVIKSRISQNLVNVLTFQEDDFFCFLLTLTQYYGFFFHSECGGVASQCPGGESEG